MDGVIGDVQVPLAARIKLTVACGVGVRWSHHIMEHGLHRYENKITGFIGLNIALKAHPNCAFMITWRIFRASNLVKNHFDYWF